MFHGKIRITFALILLGMFYEHGISEIVAWPRIQRHLNKYVKNNLLYAIKPTSVYTCAEVCIQTTLCRYFNFIMDEQLCEIHYAGTVKNRNSSFYVEAASIPSEYAGICANHNCTRYERCFPDQVKGPTCQYLGIVCGYPKVITGAIATLNDVTLDGTVEYNCSDDFFITPTYCFKKSCKNEENKSLIFWEISKEIKCVATGTWTGVRFTCTECFVDKNKMMSNMATTLTNKKCKFWTAWDQASSANFTDVTPGAAENYCRAPITGTNSDRPYLWCLTDGSAMEWDICPIPKCYAEEVKVSIQTKPSPPYYYQHHFADVPIIRFTCFEVDMNKTNETVAHCPISRYSNGEWSVSSLSCSDADCYTRATPYKGKMTCTVTGRTCQKWNKQTPHSHSIILNDANDYDSNFCRTPDGSNGNPWCFTTDPEVRYEYCWIPKC